MGKAKQRRISNQSNNPYAAGRRPHSQAKAHGNRNPAAQSQKPFVPFKSSDHILLVGEGDFSFAHSLLTHHGCTSLIATAYDTREQVEKKYHRCVSDGLLAELDACEDVSLLFGIDATKLGKTGKSISQAWFDCIVFNFPHVGGITKDVNRQVRHNQELLVGFFRSATSILAPSGSILVTVFEGEPYELWNVRDLGRHVGLKVERSFKFQAAAYPGYKHARTLGDIDGGGGWKGEDRAARTFIFKKQDDEEGEGRLERKSEGREDNSGDDSC